MSVNLAMPVLVVDDYNTMVRIIRNLLRQVGFHDIDDASDGHSALKRLREKQYGLVISDWNMEPMTGYDLLKRNARRSPSWRRALHHDHRRIQDRERDRGEAGRRLNYIVKPFNAETLKSKIEAVFPEQPRAA